MPTRVPKVPGAFFESPAPKPSAIKCDGCLSKNLILSKMIKSLRVKFY